MAPAVPSARFAREIARSNVDARPSEMPSAPTQHLELLGPRSRRESRDTRRQRMRARGGSLGRASETCGSARGQRIRACAPTATLSSRSRISAAARRVNVIARQADGGTPANGDQMRHAMRQRSSLAGARAPRRSTADRPPLPPPPVDRRRANRARSTRATSLLRGGRACKRPVIVAGFEIGEQLRGGSTRKQGQKETHGHRRTGRASEPV